MKKLSSEKVKNQRESKENCLNIDWKLPFFDWQPQEPWEDGTDWQQTTWETDEKAAITMQTQEEAQ